MECSLPQYGFMATQETEAVFHEGGRVERRYRGVRLRRCAPDAAFDSLDVRARAGRAIQLLNLAGESAPKQLISQWVIELRAITARRNATEGEEAITLQALVERLHRWPGYAAKIALCETTYHFFPTWAELEKSLNDAVKPMSDLRYQLWTLHSDQERPAPTAPRSPPRPPLSRKLATTPLPDLLKEVIGGLERASADFRRPRAELPKIEATPAEELQQAIDLWASHRDAAERRGNAALAATCREKISELTEKLTALHGAKNGA